MDKFALEYYQARFGKNATPNPKLKGVHGGNCNRTACQAPGANYWHTGTYAWYCVECMHTINRANRVDALSLYGIPKLIVCPDTITPEEREQWKSKGITVPEPIAPLDTKHIM